MNQTTITVFLNPDLPEGENRNGDCPLCHETSDAIQVGKLSWSVCDTHKLYWGETYGFGEYTDGEEAGRNRERLSAYTRCTPYFAPLA